MLGTVTLQPGIPEERETYQRTNHNEKTQTRNPRVAKRSLRISQRLPGLDDGETTGGRYFSEVGSRELR